MTLPRRARAALAGAAAMTLTATGTFAMSATAATASDEAASADCAGHAIPASQISIQLYSYAGWQGEVGTEAILAELAEIGYENVEPFGGSYEGRTAEEFRALLDTYGLSAPSAHGSTDAATFDETLAYARTIGQEYTGSGGWAAPGIARDDTSTYADVLATAAAMNELGERSVAAGTGKHFGHNHWWEFTTLVTNPDTGEQTTAYEVLLANTDPQYVAFQLDVYWASDAGADVLDLLERHGDRIELLHIKDGGLPADTIGSESFPLLTDVGEGDIDWAPILEAARDNVKYYVVERDGAPATAEFARDSFEYLTCVDFADVVPGQDFYENIRWMADRGLARGTTVGDQVFYYPTSSVSRQAMAAFLYRYADSDWQPTAGTRTFSDVGPTDPFYAEIEWLAAQGIADGYEDGTFGSTRPVSRQAMAAFLHRVAGEPAVTVSAGFSDVPANDEFAEAIAWLEQAGIAEGYSDGTFGAARPITRQAIAAFLHRYDVFTTTAAVVAQES